MTLSGFLGVVWALLTAFMLLGSIVGIVWAVYEYWSNS